MLLGGLGGLEMREESRSEPHAPTRTSAERYRGGAASRSRRGNGVSATTSRGSIRVASRSGRRKAEEEEQTDEEEQAEEALAVAHEEEYE